MNEWMEMVGGQLETHLGRRGPIVIINNNKEICYIHSGFRGYCKDAQIWRLMSKIGPGRELNFPCECILLADKIFPK